MRNIPPPERRVREVSEAGTGLLLRNLIVIHKDFEARRRDWMRLVKDKLIPLRLLIPAGPETHEWSRTYRNLIFEMASFVERHGGQVTLDLARTFVRRTPRVEILANFSEAEITLLMAKSIEYGLPVRRVLPSTKA